MKVTFSCLAAKAANVALAGDFTTWELEPKPMKKGRDGRWKAVVNLAPGRYEYKFIVDGQWIEDPEAPERSPDSYGGSNSVRVV